MQEAVGLPEVTPQRLSQWVDIKKWLQDIATHHSQETPATRPLESTRLFEEAAATGDRKRTAQVFARLLERFYVLFHFMDKELLEVTRDLIYSVQLLDAILKGIH